MKFCKQLLTNMKRVSFEFLQRSCVESKLKSNFVSSKTSATIDVTREKETICVLIRASPRA